MQRFKFAAIISAILAFAFFCTAAQAAEPVFVYYNNALIDYEDATPQIMNSRAMVPIRKTAETMGATVDWNKNTETMTITKGSRVAVHTMRSNIITVNGEAMTFDTPSAVLLDRTMMPVRMLGEALGCDVEWDNATRSVMIAAEMPSVTNASIDKTVAESGSTVNISVNTTNSATMAKAVDTTTGAVISEVTAYTENADGTKLFKLAWTPVVTSPDLKTVRVYAGDSSGYNEVDSATRTCILSITVDSTPKIKNFTADEKSVAKNDTVKVSVYTNEATSAVKITSSLDSDNIEITNYTYSGDDRLFQASIKMSKKGDCELKIYAGDSSGYQSSYETLNISVGGISSSSDSKNDDTLEITDLILDDDSVVVGEIGYVTVSTTYDIERVELFDPDDERIVKKNFSTSADKGDNERTWRLDFEVDSSGRNKFTVKAYDENDDYVTERFTVTGETIDKNSLSIVSVVQKSDDAAVGDTINFSAKTTDAAKYITIKKIDGTELNTINNFSNSGSYRMWSFSYKIADSSSTSFYVYAYDSEDKSVSKRYNINVEIAESPEILDYELESATVDEDDDVELTVYTNSAVTRVWVEDDEETRVASKKKYDDEEDDEYIWEFTFVADHSGSNLRYTIYAQNDDGEEDSYQFRLKVRD